MPSRLNKRQQRELEELSALGTGTASTSDAVPDDEEVVTKSKRGVGFSNRFLMEEVVDEGGREEEDEDEDMTPVAAKRKKKKNKKKAETPPPKNEKKAAKRAKAKEKKAGDDELEQALAELSRYPTSASSPVSTPRPTSNTLNALLAVSLPHLDPTAEMRKFFGSKVVSSSSSSSTSATAASRNTRRAAAVTQKSNLTRPQPGWWSASQREGLSIRALDSAEVRELEARRKWEVGDQREGKGEERWWTVEYSQRYKSMTKLFIQAVMSGHPDALWEVQRKLPWHADNLLQLAEVYRHREEYAQAVDFVDRALFAYERAFIGAFTFTTGTNRLDFDRVENRPFFLALHRQIADLQRRGCTRTAFEFSRLLYALDPHADPHGALFHLDLLAVKSGMGEWLVWVFEYFEGVQVDEPGVAGRKEKEQEGGGWGIGMGWGKQRETEREERKKMDPSLLPGWVYARALVLRIAEGDNGPDTDTSPSTKALQEAIRSFPEVVPLLADKLDVELPAHIRAHPSLRVHTDAGTLAPAHAALHALAHMYTTHSCAPWKDPGTPFVGPWFVQTVSSVFGVPSSLSPSTSASTLPSTPRRTTLLSLLADAEVTRTLARHILVLEGTHRRLLSFLPRDILTGAGAGGAGLACDPVPPGTGVSRYDEAYFEGVEDVFGWGGGARRGRVDEDDERILEEFVRDQDVRVRVLQFIRGLRAQFPGGLVEMMDRLGPEAVDDVLAQIQGLIVGDEDEGVGGGARDVMLDFGRGGGGGGGGGGAAEHGPVGDPVFVRGEGDEDEHEDEDEHDEDEHDDELSGIRRVFRNVLGRFWNGVVGVAGGVSSDEDDGDEGRERGGEESDGVD
ncbi:hypothetical protein C0995_014534 [Termitomyces sp. Mi166|nr:hypothetical protein C0995_014534 [Termitomyces sp. Mi166\